jgi:hypothetical protein
MRSRIRKSEDLILIAIAVATRSLLAWYSSFAGACACSLIETTMAGKESVNMESAKFLSDTNVTLGIRNTGLASVIFQIYYVQDASGDAWQRRNWTPPGQPLPVNNLLIVNIAIGSGVGGCGHGCQYTSTTGAFTAFQSGNSYTVTMTTSRNNQFVFTVTR